jgi:hypothetical protein
LHQFEPYFNDRIYLLGKILLSSVDLFWEDEALELN